MLPQKVKTAFNLHGQITKLPGGQETSLFCDGYVIKPIDDEPAYLYSANILSQLHPHKYRISKPIKSIWGNYIEEGYGAAKYLEGQHDHQVLKEILQVSNDLHHDLKALNLTGMPIFDNPWAKAHEVLWRKMPLPQEWDNQRRSFINELLMKLPTLSPNFQLIHSDLGGNVLFDKVHKPLVIDFSPAYAPKEYADAIIVCDAIAWEEMPLSSVDLLEPLLHYKPYIIYAIAFRVITIAFMKGYTYKRLLEEWHAYNPILNHLGF